MFHRIPRPPRVGAPHRPEILAPAGDDAALAAALAAGADAVYFGLDEGFNARARASNFSVASLPAVVARIHRAGARAYVTLNTLVFESELPTVERLLRAIARAGVDAIIVQDPAVALIARALCPTLAVHASTQMTVSSAEGARVAARLGATRVVVPRELSVEEIARFAAESPIELEVFVHGALCVSWSGQCLTSESWGGRSANRGQCAQSCRLPYDLVVDGEVRELGEVRYLLSPRDLAGAGAVPALVAAGVASLKIEGRQKGPAYVATAVGGYRRWRDSIVAGSPDEAGLARDLAAMGLAYTRGQSPGFLAGTDHQRLVVGLAPKHRGVYVGTVEVVAGDTVELVTDGVWTSLAPEAAPVEPRAGLGVVFDQGRPEDDEIGGFIFGVERVADDRIRLRFGRPGPDLTRVGAGARVWITSDPAAHRAAEKLGEREPDGRIALALTVAGVAGAPLRVRAQVGVASVEVASELALAAARTGTGLDAALLHDKLGATGGTRFHVASIATSDLAPGLHLPVSELKAVRRRLVTAMETLLDQAVLARQVEATPVVARVRSEAWAGRERGDDSMPACVVPLCRTADQLMGVIDAGATEVELDWMEMVGLARAVASARARGVRVVVATPRVQKPGEDKMVAHLRRLEPDAILVRSWAALATLEGAGVPLHGDFSLNVTNSITAGFALGLGLETVTASHDLDAAQLDALLAAMPGARLAVTVHHHIPTFHTEHCVYAHLLSDGKDFRTCGRPCEQHEVSLRDRTGLPHPVVVDVGCRNTVFNAQAQTAAALVPSLRVRGVARFRVELVREPADQAAALYTAYRALVRGEQAPADVVRIARAHEQFGVTRGTMRTLPVLS